MDLLSTLNVDKPVYLTCLIRYECYLSFQSPALTLPDKGQPACRFNCEQRADWQIAKQLADIFPPVNALHFSRIPLTVF